MSGEIDKLLPYGIGAIALLALLLFVARPFLTTLATEAARATPRAVLRLYRRLRPVGGRKLRRYRNQVRAENSRVRLGLSQSRDASPSGTPGLQDVYVPLQCERNGGRGDASSGLRDHPRTVLLGAPGAGKSLLLKYEMLEWADRGDDKKLPVIVELHTCNSTEEPLETLITRKFEQAGISTAKDMVQSRLDSGGLRVFFDGLDEVGTEQFERVVRQLREFPVRYEGCEVVVSCRTAAYDQQLEDVFDQEIRIAEFDDASVLRFLSKWPDLRDRATVARVFQALQDDPELMVLARSPLMLTMIAYLQSGDRPESVGPLPSSRAKFYDMAVNHLLDRDRLLNRSEALGQYHVTRKTMVLQRLALAQLSESSARGDRQEISRSRFESVIDDMLPDFNLERDPHLQGLLNEIVSRSELIKDIDRGRHYQFTHLTLQEYLAAYELRRDEQRLMEHYRRDPLAWRETVRMWCAVADGGCSDVVREVFDDPDLGKRVLALHCLADAVAIDPVLADEILAFFQDRLGDPDDAQGDIAKGLGTLAASSSPRGRRVREALIQAARERVSPRRSASLRALTVSGRQEAAHALAGLRDQEARAALQAMGDVAVPSLAREAAEGNLWAVRSLGVVGTPAAALQLADLVHSARADASKASCAAAWQLAQLLRNPEVRAALDDWQPDSPAAPLPSRTRYDWVWEPFRHEDKLSDLIARIAGYLDHRNSDDEAREGVTAIHPRIGIPLFATVPFRSLPDDSDAWLRLEQLIDAATRIVPASLTLTRLNGARRRRHMVGQLFSSEVATAEGSRRVLEPLRDHLLHSHRIHSRHQAVLRSLPWAAQTQLIAFRFGRPERTELTTHDLRGKWKYVRENPAPPRALTALAWTTGLALSVSVLLVAGTRLVSGVFRWHPWGLEPWGTPWAAAAMLLLGVAGAVTLLRTNPAAILLGFLIELGWFGYCSWLALTTGRDLMGWPLTTAVALLLATVSVTAGALTARINGRRDNPLRTALAAAE